MTRSQRWRPQARRESEEVGEGLVDALDEGVAVDGELDPSTGKAGPPEASIRALHLDEPVDHLVEIGNEPLDDFVDPNDLPSFSVDWTNRLRRALAGNEAEPEEADELGSAFESTPVRFPSAETERKRSCSASGTFSRPAYSRP